MKRTVLMGAGQIGTMAGRLLGGNYTPVCYADNNPARHGAELCGLPILSVADSLRMNPDCVCLCVLDQERFHQMEHQLRNLGFNGEIISLDSLLTFDTRLATMRLLAEQIEYDQVSGSVAELGVYRGEFAKHINAAFPTRTLHLFDTFEGFSVKDIGVEQQHSLSRAVAGDFSDTDITSVLSNMSYPERIQCHKGYFPHTFPKVQNETFAFVSVDADLYAPTAAALPLFWERLSPGGVIMVHDYNSTQFLGVKKAVREFCRKAGLYAMPVCDLHGSVVLMKQGGRQL